jgi:hypothetical protein
MSWVCCVVVTDTPPVDVDVVVKTWWGHHKQAIRKHCLETRPVHFVADLCIDLGIDVEGLGDPRALSFFEAAEVCVCACACVRVCVCVYVCGCTQASIAAVRPSDLEFNLCVT